MDQASQGGQTASDENGESAATERAPRRLTRIESLLIEHGVLSLEALHAAKARQRGAKKPFVEVLLEQQAVDEDLLVDVIATATGLSVASEDDLDPDPEVQDLVPAEAAQRLGVLPLRLEEDVLYVATGDPFQVVAFDELFRHTQYEVRRVFAKPSSVRRAMRTVRQGEEEIHELVKNAMPVDTSFIVEKDKPKEKESHAEGKAAALSIDATEDAGPTVQLVNLVISDGIARKASDIHIEAEKEVLRVRLRLDGELRDILSLPRNVHASVLSRIKIIAGLDIIETRRPQDGRAKVSVSGKTYDLRVSTIPSYFGEKCVIRILDQTAASFKLNKTGLPPAVLGTWRKLIKRPHGLVLMTGPTGSGKTSTLYASLLEIRCSTLNIVTVEDPVEYQFPGIVHVPVQSHIGMTFAAALRSILRQDPDVVLLGEIRDQETADVAVQAALTGHLVLSTLHTNDAFGAIPRLLDLGIERDRLASCLTAVMAQRLARTICPSCAEPHAYPHDELVQIGHGASTPAEGTRRGSGCRRCFESGSRGRTALAELVVVTPELSKALLAGAGESQLREQIRKDGTRTLVEAGLDKVLAGTCTPAEILRVAAPELVGQEADQEQPETSLAIEPEERHILPVPSPPPPSAAPVSGAARSCVPCGAEVQTGWKVCPMCGAALSEAPTGPVALVCDDEPVARRVAAAALRRIFPVIHEVQSGEEALESIATRMPDLFLVDMMMPGLSGIEVIRALRSDLATASLPIIMLTASTDEELEEETLLAGADDYLSKPITAARLCTRAKALLRARQRVAEAAV